MENPKPLIKRIETFFEGQTVDVWRTVQEGKAMALLAECLDELRLLEARVMGLEKLRQMEALIAGRDRRV